jgi:hypothetical protein
MVKEMNILSKKFGNSFLDRIKRIRFSRLFWIALSIFFPFFLEAQDPTYLLELRNDVQVSSTVYEFDIYLLRTGVTELEYASGQYGITVNPLIKNGGTLTATMVPDSPDPVLVASNQTPSSVNFYDLSNVIRVAGRTPPGAGGGAIISNATPGIKICRVRLSNTVDFELYRPNLTWTTTTLYPTQVTAYVGGTNTVITNHSNHASDNLVNPVLNMLTSSENFANDEFDPGLEVYPNPFNNRLTINYSFLKSTNVKLSVFDSGGRMVEQLINDHLQAGSYSLQWMPVALPAGNYVLKFESDLAQKTSRITLIR